MDSIIPGIGFENAGLLWGLLLLLLLPLMPSMGVVGALSSAELLWSRDSSWLAAW